VPAHLRVGVLGRPGLDRRPPGGVAAVGVDEQDALEALAVQRADEVAQQRAVDLRADRRAAGKGREVRRDPVRQRRQHGHAERLGRLLGDALGEDRVDAERQVGVLLDRPERQHDPIVVLEVGLELHPVAIDDTHSCIVTSMFVTLGWTPRKATIRA